MIHLKILDKKSFYVVCAIVKNRIMSNAHYTFANHLHGQEWKREHEAPATVLVSRLIQFWFE